MTLWVIPDLIFVPVAALLRENQPDICTLDDGRKKDYRFQMDLNDEDSVDISISLQLTERTLIKEENVSAMSLSLRCLSP